MHHSQGRATLGGKLSAVLVAAGSSVGLGNIWRFPYVAGDNGGGAFLLIYIGCVLLLGLPIMVAEFSVGRASHRNAVGAYRALDPKWSFLGYNGVVAAFLILGFYFVVSGWTAEYMVHSLTGSLAEYSSAEEYKTVFETFIRNPWRPVVYTSLFVLATHFVITMGVQKGIERSAKVLMPLLFVILIALSIHSLLMPGGGEGVRFLFRPDFSKVTPSTVLVALGQAFFSLSIGIGTMVTYASYFKPDTNLRHTALNVTILDTLVAVLAGVVIFPAVFSVGIEPSSGPSLVFITLPGIFNSMPLSMVWSSVFFLLLVVAALTSTISLHEVITAYMHEEWHMSRRAAAWATTGSCMALAAVASLSLGLLDGWRIFGLSVFDSLDFLTANILLPAGGFFTCIFVGWRLDQKVLKGHFERRRAEIPHLRRIHLPAALHLPGGAAADLPRQSGTVLKKERAAKDSLFFSVDVAPVRFVIRRGRLHVDLQFDHIDSRGSRFVTLVAVTAAAAVESLLHVVDRQHAESNGHVPLDLQLRDALRHALADEVEMARVALDNASQRDNGIDIGVFREELGAERQFEGAGDIFDLDVHVGAPCGTQRAHGPLQQRFGDLAVPLGHDDAEPHVRGRRQG